MLSSYQWLICNYYSNQDALGLGPVYWQVTVDCFCL